jgi:ribosomal protein S27AE
MKKLISLILAICFVLTPALSASAANYRYEDLKYSKSHLCITPDDMLDGYGNLVYGAIGFVNYCRETHLFFATNEPECPFCGETGWMAERLPSNPDECLGVYFYDNAMTVKVSAHAWCPECGTILSVFSQAANINDWINPSLGKNTCERCGHKWAADDFTYTIVPYCTGARENVDFADCNEDNCSQKKAKLLNCWL